MTFLTVQPERAKHLADDFIGSGQQALNSDAALGTNLHIAGDRLDKMR